MMIVVNHYHVMDVCDTHIAETHEGAVHFGQVNAELKVATCVGRL